MYSLQSSVPEEIVDFQISNYSSLVKTAMTEITTKSSNISKANACFVCLGDLLDIDFVSCFGLLLFLLLCLVDFLEISSFSFLSSFFSRLLFLEEDLLSRSADLLFRSYLLFLSADLLFLWDRGEHDIRHVVLMWHDSNVKQRMSRDSSHFQKA